jgi:hypothetical protein
MKGESGAAGAEAAAKCGVSLGFGPQISDVPLPRPADAKLVCRNYDLT